MSPASAADRLTSAVVTGPTGTVWDTTVNGFYTLFLQTPGLGDFLNPNDEAINFETTPGGNGFLLAGDGFRPGEVADSDPFYDIVLSFASGNTLSGQYTPLTNTFVGGSSYTTGGFTYSLAEFSYRRNLGNSVSQYVAVPGGDGNDYSGNVRLDVVAAAGVPEPATWGLMILGFGAVGGSMRRRKSVLATA
ncbi:hypothetical protein ASG29_02270 [Sphingomonas sp. Leaf412]|nr:hypothetical protein ASG29_02270 [Sphingomonas sp. Leaf412]